jgi:hypothetical protein
VNISGLFHGALQWVLVLARQAFNQSNLGLGDFVRVNTGDADAFAMDVEHDLNGLGGFLVKNVLENLHDKFFGGVIVVMQQDFVERWSFELLLGLGDNLMLEFFPSAHAAAFLAKPAKIS